LTVSGWKKCYDEKKQEVVSAAFADYGLSGGRRKNDGRKICK
jgi:hypothetical protein